MESGLGMFRVWTVERNPTEGKNRQYSVRKDINVEDTNMVGVERERKRNLSYGTRKMVIKHDEEMAQNKMKVDKLLWWVGGGIGDGFVKKRNTESQRIETRIQSTVELPRVVTSGAE